MRSNSRISGWISDESDTASPGNSRRMRLADRLLVARIDIGVQQAHGDRRRRRRRRAATTARDFREVERGEHGARRVHALGGFAAHRARHQRRRQVDAQIVDVVARFACPSRDVAKAARHDEAGARALALDQRVGDERRRVDKEIEIGRRLAVFLQQSPRAVDDCNARIGRGGQQLARRDRAGCAIVQHEVGKSAADVDRQPESA